MNINRDPVAGPQRMLAVGENLHVAIEAAEQRLQARPREEILVIALEQMPGNDAPVIEVGQQFHVRNGKESTVPDDARNFTNKYFGIFDVFEDLDTNGRIEFRVVARQAGRIAIDLAKPQLPPVENLATMRVRLQTKPIMRGEITIGPYCSPTLPPHGMSAYLSWTYGHAWKEMALTS